MGIYLNPGNHGFRRILKSKYIDKSGLIHLMNQNIDTTNNLVCISRPRRFGKSYAAQMLCAYYDCSCDSHILFDDLEIAKSVSYESHLNQYNVIYLDITGFISEIKKNGRSIGEVPVFISQSIEREVKALYPEIGQSESLLNCLIECTKRTGRKFIFIIDEWDSMVREAKQDPDSQERYFNFLRSLFKNGNFTPTVVAAAYMTGILPIKKDGSQSAISDFKEYTMIKPRKYGAYVGFKENEVEKLCKEAGIDFPIMKRWYDGYVFKDVGSVYNPNSVMQAIENEDFDSYWSETSAAESLMEYISKGYSGLTKTIAELIGGVDVEVDTNGFANDLATFRGKDDVLTLLIHLGYLAYDSGKKSVRIPNEEIRLEFSKSIREVRHAETMKRLQDSDKLFYDTIHGNEAAVAAQIEKVHMEETTPLHYNKEESLRSVIKLAYYTYKDNYLQWEELPAGNGYADIVYLPKKDSDYPALVIELKWNQTAKGAIDQILDRNYPSVLNGFGKDIILVGVNYDKDAPPGHRKHVCEIKKIRTEAGIQPL